MNIGICVFHPDRSDVRIESVHRKISALDGTVDRAFLESLRVNLTRWLDKRQPALDEETRIRLLKGFAGIEASEVSWFKVNGYEEYETTVHYLMKELVVPRSRPRPPTRQPRLIREIKDSLRRHEVLGTGPGDIERHCVVADYPICELQDLYADFAVRNGVMSVAEVQDYRGATAIGRGKPKEAAWKAVALDQSEKVFGENTVRIFAYAASASEEMAIRPTLDLMNGYATEIYNLEGAGDKAAFFERLLSATGRTIPLSR